MEYCPHCERNTRTEVLEGNNPCGGMTATPVCSLCGDCRCESCNGNDES